VVRVSRSRVRQLWRLWHLFELYTECPVLLQPLATEPPPHAKCKDKFLVQSAFITPDEEMRTLSEMVRLPASVVLKSRSIN
jgi:hypothetical protein